MKSILIIEDDSYLTRTLSNFLRIAGYEVVAAHNAQTSMKIIKSYQLDLILCDIALGGDNGYSILRWLRKSVYRNTPFIFISGKVKTKEIMHGLKSGADDYITKPFEYQAFIDKVKAFIGHAKEQTQIPFNNQQLKLNLL